MGENCTRVVSTVAAARSPGRCRRRYVPCGCSPKERAASAGHRLHRGVCRIPPHCTPPRYQIRRRYRRGVGQPRHGLWRWPGPVPGRGIGGNFAFVHVTGNDGVVRGDKGHQFAPARTAGGQDQSHSGILSRSIIVAPLRRNLPQRHETGKFWKLLVLIPFRWSRIRPHRGRYRSGFPPVQRRPATPGRCTAGPPVHRAGWCRLPGTG